MENGMISYKRFIAGDENGFEEVVHGYAKPLVRYITNIINNSTAAEDLTEDVFVVLYLKKISFREEAAFKAYIYKTARNKAINYLKKHKLSRNLSLELAVNVPSGDNVERDYSNRERNNALKRALTKTKPEYREILTLFYFQNLNYTEIAEKIGQSEKRVANVLYRAKRQLKTILEKEGFNYEDYR